MYCKGREGASGVHERTSQGRESYCGCRESAYRVCVCACIGRESTSPIRESTVVVEAVGVFLESMRMIVAAVRVLVEAIIILFQCL